MRQEDARPAAGDMMDTHEVAEYLRVKERKVYELVRDRRIPCVRVTGKWLFPRALIDEWLISQADRAGTPMRRQAPPVIAGSHCPLLDWALRESGCGLAMLPGGSLDGLAKLAAGEAQVALVHILDPERCEYNIPAVRAAGLADAVVIEWAWRTQGLVVGPGNPLGLAGVADLRTSRARVVPRQQEAGSRVLLEHLLRQAGIAWDDIAMLDPPARSETDVGLAVQEGRADAGLAVEAVARSLRLGFVPLARERADLVLHRRDYFEPPVQRLLALARTPAFADRAAALGGYDVTGLGTVQFNA